MADTSTGLVSNLKDVTVSSGTPARKVGQELDKNAFLKLLTTQLSNQDPMKPMDDSSFISQMAQFSSLEQMQNMNQVMEKQQSFGQLSQASGMIGKYVQVISTDEHQNTSTVTGLVSEVRQGSGKVNVVINGQEYDSTMISNVSDKPISGIAGAPSAATPTTTTTSTTGTTGTTATTTGTTATGV